jgi:hypothetical protein
MQSPKDPDKVPLDYDEEPLSRTSSQSAASTSNASSSPLAGCFNPIKYFFIYAHGISAFHIMRPSHDNIIKVTDASEAIVFTSERPSRWSAVTSFHSASKETLGEMTGDRFSNFPLRVIEIHLLGNDGMEIVKIKRRALTTRGCVFVYGGWEWEWRYGRRDEGAKMNGHTMLVLERIKEGGGERTVVARLLRDHDADKKGGTKSTDAGRGGKLELGIADEGQKIEVLVIMSCLVMLKKEIDRRRTARGIPVVTGLSAISGNHG